MSFMTRSDIEYLANLVTENIDNKALSIFVVQLNKYETAPNFIQSIQNLTSDCLLI